MVFPFVVGLSDGVTGFVEGAENSSVHSSHLKLMSKLMD